MTDDELLAHAIYLCDEGERLPNADTIQQPRLRRIVAADNELQARYLVPALVELIERRGLREASVCAACGNPSTGLSLVTGKNADSWRRWCGDPACRETILAGQ